MAAPFLDAVLPPRCGLCGELADGWVCHRCRRALDRMPSFGEYRLPGLSSAWAAFEHAGPARKLVVTAKHRSRPALLELAVAEIAKRVPPSLLDDACLVPVPPDPWRARRRGFDAAAEIAAGLAAVTGARVAPRLRRRRSAAQAAKSRQGRLGADFAVSSAGLLPARIVLVDDVATTGATLAACATAARDSGARELRAVTVTRSAGRRELGRLSPPGRL